MLLVLHGIEQRARFLAAHSAGLTRIIAGLRGGLRAARGIAWATVRTRGALAGLRRGLGRLRLLATALRLTLSLGLLLLLWLLLIWLLLTRLLLAGFRLALSR